MTNTKKIVSPDTQRKNRIPPGQKVVERLPVLHYGSTPSIDSSSWYFTIGGSVKKERTLSYTEFIALPQVEVFSDIHCVTGWSTLNNLWEGVSTGVIRKIANILPEARFVVVHSAGGYTTNLSLNDFFEEDVLFALKLDGKPLLLEHGYPVRLVVPKLYFWKSAKWAVGIEFSAEDRPGFWESRRYHNHGDPLERRKIQQLLASPDRSLT